MKQIKEPKIAPPLQLYKWIMNPLGFLDNCAQKYGDTFNLNLFGLPPFTIVSHPQANQEIFSVDAKQFDVGRGNGLIRVLVGDNSLFLMDGDRPVVPKRRGGTIAPHNGVPIVLKGQRSRLQKSRSEPVFNQT